MTVECESELRMALRHVKTGRSCIMRQQNVIVTLRDKGLPTDQAEVVLQWLEEAQRGFEEHYKRVLSDGFQAIHRAQDLSPFPTTTQGIRLGGGLGELAALALELSRR